MGKKAIVLGATGATGSNLLKLLLKDERYEQVIVFSRRALEVHHNKLQVVICDMMDLNQVSKYFIADELFCCIGTTKSKTKDKNIYREIDYGIPVTAAKLCESNQLKRYVVISAIGANSNSPFFYSRIKGDMEKAVLASQIQNVTIIRPSVIYGNRKEFRIAEKFTVILLKTIQFLLIGKLKKYRAINSYDLAKLMLRTSVGLRGKHIIHQDFY